MPLIRDEGSHRLHVQSKLMGESLVGKTFLEGLDYPEPFRVFPEVNVLKIGGQSIIDIGANAVQPIIEEIVENAQKHKMIISTGGGTRSRHVYAIALELGMPTGIIAKLGQSVSEQNALMMATLLGPFGGIKIGHDDLPLLAAYLNQNCIPVVHGMPPYGYWEQLPKIGRLPPNRTDVGTYLLAEVIGAKQCLFIKDEDGLYTDNPKKETRVKFISRIGAKELKERNLDDIVIERQVLELLLASHSVTQIQIINGLKPGNITSALNGEHVGTIIYKDV